MRSLIAYGGQPITRAASVLLALLFQSPGNMRKIEWAETDLAYAIRTVLAMKMEWPVQCWSNGRSHLVPRAKRAIAVL